MLLSRRFFAAILATEDARRLTASGLANAVLHQVRRLVHGDEFFRRRRMHGHRAVEIVLGKPSLERDTQQLRHLAGVGAEDGGHRRVSMWFLVVPIVLTIAAAALAFFLLSPREEELTATVDQTAVAVAVANAEPAKPAFTPPPSSPPPATQ